MNLGLVSVVIPTYNRAEYLRVAIASVLSQTYENFELLVLDNCSQDHTQEVVESFSDPRIKYLRHQCNIGALANWTYGISWANGKYLSILGDDDLYCKDFLINRVKLLTENPSAIVVFSPYVHIDMNGGLVGSYNFDIKDNAHVITGKDLMNAVRGFSWFLGSSLYVLEEIKALWPLVVGRCGITPDFGLHLLLTAKSDKQAVWYPVTDYYYRVHSNQDSYLNKLDMMMDGVLTVQMIRSRGYGRPYTNELNDLIAYLANTVGRLLWDKGNSELAKYYFVKELKISPYRITTWLRLIRCLIRCGVKHGE